MHRKRLFLLWLLLLAAVDASGAQGVAHQDGAADAQSTRSGTWSATTSGGLPLMGRWTAILDSTKSSVTGTWTLVDPGGRLLASGAWSAAKSRARWTGSWRAVYSGRQGEYAGTWSSGTDLEGNARFADLFEKAANSVVSGDWRRGRQSGAWAIRTAKREGAP